MRCLMICLSCVVIFSSGCGLYPSQESFIQNGTPVVTSLLTHESQDLTPKIYEIQSCKYYQPLKSSATTQKERRIALIIANSEYFISSLNLQSTKEDGRKVAHELSKSNFEVILCQNSPLSDIETITHYFVKSKIEEDEIPLTMIFYYSGHGVIIPSFEEMLKNNRQYHDNLAQKIARKTQKIKPIKKVSDFDPNDELSVKIKANKLARQHLTERLTKPLCEYNNKPQEKTSSYLVPSDICKSEKKGLAKSYSKDNLFSINDFLKNLSNQLKLSQNKKAFLIIDACNSPPDDIIEYEKISQNLEIKGGKVSLTSSLAAPDFSVIDLERMLVLYGATPGSFSGANKDVGGILTSHLLEGIRNGVSATSILYTASSATTQTNETFRTNDDLRLKNLGFPWLIGATGMFMDFYFRPIYQSTLPWN